MIKRLLTFLKTTLTRGDLLLICLLLACTIASFSLWFKGKPGSKAIVIVDGEIIHEIALTNNNKTLKIQGAIGISTITIEARRVRMQDSPCPCKTCIKMGWIADEGEMISCIPNRVLIKITGPQEAPYDALAR